MASIDSIRASNGGGNAAVATVQSTRAPLSSTIVVDTVDNINDTFMGAMGTPHTFIDPVTSEEITVISEATAVDFAGHVDGANLEIDTIAPGYTDLGSEIGDIVVIRPTTQHTDNLADVLDVSHNDDGSLTEAAVLGSLASTRGVPGAIHIYTGSDTWTKPAGLKFVSVEVQAGGGAGGSADGTGAQGGAGAGAGAGGYSYKKIAVASLGATETVTVGAGGTPGAAGNNPGGDGGNSSFGTHATATKGSGGGGGASSATDGISAATPGAGGAAASGDINITGQTGHKGFRLGTSGMGGSGGGSQIGRGGPAVGSSADGLAGVGYGSGGGGAATNSATDKAGGAGAGGIVIVKEYYQGY